VTQAPDDQEEIICKCFQVSEKTIRDTITTGNLNSIESVTQACKAGGGCHSCHILIQFYIDQFQASKKLVEQSVIKEKSPSLWGKLFRRKKSTA
jgi:NifU-like protein